MHGMMIVALVLIFNAALVANANADELSDFESGRQLYERGQYQEAAEEFQSLVGGRFPNAQNPIIRLEARKYLGASYLFIERPNAARRQFRLILEEDPGYEIDPVAFPKSVVETFLEVQSKVQLQQNRVREKEAAQEFREREAQMRNLVLEQERIRRLEELVASETIEQVNSRWIAALPFGIGQFQNGDRRLGIGLAVVESTFLVASFATFIAHNRLRNESPNPNELARAQRAERALRITNWVSSGVFGGVAIGGIIDAQLRFKPVIQSTRQRELPENLRKKESSGTSWQLELGLGGGRLSVRY